MAPSATKPRPENRGKPARRTGPRPEPRAPARIPAARARAAARLAPRKPARQDRSRATVEAIVGAAVELLSTRGYARTSTNHIATRAGVSVGSLYQYFPGKDAIVAVIFERHADEVERVVEAAFAELRRPDVPIREAFRRMVAGFEEAHQADPSMAQALEAQADWWQPFADLVRHREERFRNELADVLRRRPDVRRGNHAVMASLLFDVMDAVMRSLMHGDARRFDRRQALAEATEAFCRYVEA